MKLLHSFLKKSLVTGFIILFLGLIALSEGTGYETIEISHKTLTFGSRTVDYGALHGGPGEIGLGHMAFICNVNVSLNPFLYPLSYLMGDGKRSYTSWKVACPLVINYKDEVMNSAKFGAVLPEFLKNLPYILFIGFLIESVIEKLMQKFFSKPH